MDALVSIVTPVYNAEKYIRASVESVLAQTYTNWELLIVDDCSSDNTVAVVSAFSDPRIRLFTLEFNSGPGIARDTAVGQAKGNYIAFLDADDLWYPDKLKLQLQWMQNHKQPFTFSFYDLVDENGDPTGMQVTAPLKLSYRQLFYCNYVGNLTGIYSVDYFGKIPISRIRKRQDWILWLEIMKQIKHARPVPQSLALYRIREGSVSSSKISLLKYNYAVYRDYHQCNPVVAVLSMIVFLYNQLLIKRRDIVRKR
jgi:teichuronic acid biosynthesis glycosyltransferase TuaG